MEYDKKFIDTCEAIFAKIIQNRPLKECLNTAVTITSDHLWFIYYMFFAIHNPKMEEYIQKKTQRQQNPQRRQHLEQRQQPILLPKQPRN